FTNETNEISYKMPHKIEQYKSLSDIEKDHTKSVYLKNEEDKRRGVEYVMSKILGFYKECLELGPEYAIGIADEGEVTQDKDAKTLFEAIQVRFGGNDATKKTQKTLLKQMYKKFNAPSTESLDSMFNRL
nr:ribonuclease H-like domain-containing protein [Tanacetum cinerariifolium]